MEKPGEEVKKQETKESKGGLRKYFSFSCFSPPSFSLTEQASVYLMAHLHVICIATICF